MNEKQIKLIKTLYKSADYEQKEKIKECFPEVFELPETGWLKHKDGVFVYRTGSEQGYGLNFNNEWIIVFDGDEFMSWSFLCDPHEWQPATETEVKEMLIKEAKRRGVWDCPIFDPNEVKMKNKFNFDNEGFSMKYNMLHSNYGLVFDNGKWATKLEEPKTETIHLFGNTYKISLVN
jgi:endo-1,4-beta-D-glucanase Y